MPTFQGQKIQGLQSIVSKLTSLPFQHCQQTITIVNCQPSDPGGGMLVLVSGNLQLPSEQHALKFSQASLSVLPCFAFVNPSACIGRVNSELEHLPGRLSFVD